MSDETSDGVSLDPSARPKRYFASEPRVGTGAASDGQTRCRRCAKPIIWPGRCYTCATGLPRHFRRAEEGSAT